MACVRWSLSPQSAGTWAGHVNSMATPISLPYSEMRLQAFLAMCRMSVETMCGCEYRENLSKDSTVALILSISAAATCENCSRNSRSSSRRGTRLTAPFSTARGFLIS
ncbi:MAG: hypothetical protein BWY85_02321 [Firmicutes bacterium ADurb.Bin506]|nr:MAG: hypothetical protein BWY85_02321 [Firmicutes bacterium ADurb.Bin506]